MKKLFFSAVALLAFSTVSMANTIEVKKIIFENEMNISEQKSIPTINACAIYALAIYATLSNAGINDEDCANEAAVSYDYCTSN